MMKDISKAISVFLFFSMLIAACGVVTAVPKVTATSTTTALPTATYSPSETPTSVPTITPTSTPVSLLPAFVPSNDPQKTASDYKLRPWLEEDYGYILDSIQDIDNDVFEIPYSKIPDYMAVFQSERLLRFPDSPEVENRLWEMVLTKP
jgi:hypothetical protein